MSAAVKEEFLDCAGIAMSIRCLFSQTSVMFISHVLIIPAVRFSNQSQRPTIKVLVDPPLCFCCGSGVKRQFVCSEVPLNALRHAGIMWEGRESPRRLIAIALRFYHRYLFVQVTPAQTKATNAPNNKTTGKAWEGQNNTRFPFNYIQCVARREPADILFRSFDTFLHRVVTA